MDRSGFFNSIGRVEMWRGGCRSNISVSAPFVWRCLSGSTMTPFPHPAHRTGQADFPHPALGQDFTPLLSRATPSAVSEHKSEFIGCPISWFFATYCVCLELRSLPSTGITQLPRYYEPLRHPRAPGLSLTGSGWSSLRPRYGASRVACAFLVCMLSPLPRHSDWRSCLAHSAPVVSAFPDMAVRSARALSFSRLAQRSLALRPAHSRCHRIS